MVPQLWYGAGSDQGPNVPVRAELLERYRNKRARRGTQPPARYAGRKATADSRWDAASWLMHAGSWLPW